MLLAIAGGFWLSSRHLHDLPQQVQIFHGNQLVARYPYPRQGDQPKQIQVMGDIGEAVITLSADGVRMIDAPCRNKQCILSGLHHHSGDMIICLPNRVSVLIIGEASNSPHFDALSQ
ncbi:MAG: NusG domain II-containing protein [Mariprofundales bacterium]